MLLEIIKSIVNLHQTIFRPFDILINNLSMAEWIKDALIDTIHLAPFLFIIFVLIELSEQKYSKKINQTLQNAKKMGVVVGSFASIFPQCGFSVIAASLYCKKYITRGILIAVFLTTSDETIPILLTYPEKSYLIIPIVIIKLIAGIFFGYLIDFIKPSKTMELKEEIVIEEGCCKHSIINSKKKELIIHPIHHTLNILFFILLVTLFLNYCFEHNTITNLITGNKFIQPILASLIGLIPNCAISVGITIMLIKGVITFGSAMSGLLANAGLGFLILLKNNSIKDTLVIATAVVSISVLVGWIINIIC